MHGQAEGLAAKTHGLPRAPPTLSLEGPTHSQSSRNPSHLKGGRSRRGEVVLTPSPCLDTLALRMGAGVGEGAQKIPSCAR